MKRIGDQSRGFIQAMISIAIMVIIFYLVVNTALFKFFWNSFVSNMQRIHDGKPTDWQLAAPRAVFK